MLLLDEMPTQDDVLPPLCIFSAHSVEESWGSRVAGTQHTHSTGSVLHVASQGCPSYFSCCCLVLVLALNTRVYVLWESGDVRVVKRLSEQPS